MHSFVMHGFSFEAIPDCVAVCIVAGLDSGCFYLPVYSV